MKVVVFCWEYPPNTRGQLANYVKAISNQLAARNVEVDVVTYTDGPYSQTDEAGVKIIYVPNPIRTHPDLLTWVLMLNQEIEKAAANIYYDTGGVDVIDVFDWHFVPAATTLKLGLGIPFLFSVDSIEYHRAAGASLPFNMAIESLEWLGMYEAGLVGVKSDLMRDEIARFYHVPKIKIRVADASVPDDACGYVKLLEETKNG
ncbi:MAG: glycosyltransferase [Candidatus Bathyarchaeota archaeon]|nr:glycosyltransferase [Candidatus Bathyarchaeota archaeon]